MITTICIWFLMAAFGSSGKQASLEAQSSLPRPQGFVNDFAEKLSPPAKLKLEKTLREFVYRAGVDFVVVTVPHDFLQGATIEDYSLRLGSEWGVGRGPDKLGLILLLAIKANDNDGTYSGHTRLRVSRKLESDIPDDVAKQIITKARADFQAGRFDRGVTNTVTEVIATLTARRAVPKK